MTKEQKTFREFRRACWRMRNEWRNLTLLAWLAWRAVREPIKGVAGVAWLGAVICGLVFLVAVACGSGGDGALLADYAECLFDKGLARDATAADTLARLQDDVAAGRETMERIRAGNDLLCAE